MLKRGAPQVGLNSCPAPDNMKTLYRFMSSLTVNVVPSATTSAIKSNLERVRHLQAVWLALQNHFNNHILLVRAS